MRLTEACHGRDLREPYERIMAPSRARPAFVTPIIDESFRLIPDR